MSDLQKNQKSSTKKKSTTTVVLDKIESGLEITIFNSRWLLAPFYLGLVISIGLLFVKFAQELYHLTIHVTTASGHAISAIDLLKTFMEIPDTLTEGQSEMFLWKVTIHMAFVLSGVLFAVMDRISSQTKSH